MIDQTNSNNYYDWSIDENLIIESDGLIYMLSKQNSYEEIINEDDKKIIFLDENIVSQKEMDQVIEYYKEKCLKLEDNLTMDEFEKLLFLLGKQFTVESIKINSNETDHQHVDNDDDEKFYSQFLEDSTEEDNYSHNDEIDEPVFGQDDQEFDDDYDDDYSY